ncbi:Kelch repeat-containing protein [Geosporobacter ferrireducens]|uniref:Uncharacterized protein n=1 Tax=Geosporobacter ferrireducens TaxID=1424294 RepID=A0A1D8GIG1_9FIRM|nr:hypothetical protein [Geosporobacter ferrireducens]AOT70680.1 hypothetical protein Gferi_14520 [Geosporobacter ferrireducens]
MANYNVEIKKRNPANTAWDNLYPVTKASNVITQSGQSIEAHLADYVRQPGYGVTSGSANTYTLTLNPALTAYTAGVCVAVKIHAANTGASTININGVGAKSIRDSKGNVLTSGKLVLNSVYTLRYDGTNFILQGEGASGNATASDLLSGKTATTDAGEIVGTMPNRGAVTITPSNSNQTISAGYHNGSGIVSAVTFDASRVLTGTTIAGTAGTMPNHGAITITPGATTQTRSSGYMSSLSVAGSTNLSAENIKLGVNIFGVTGTLTPMPTGWSTGQWIASGSILPNGYYNHAAGGTFYGCVISGGDSSSSDTFSCQLWNGVSYSSAGSMPSSNSRHASTGANQSAVAVTGGGRMAANRRRTILYYNGTSWSQSGNMTDTRQNHGCCGVQNNHINVGDSYSSSVVYTSELWNGTAATLTASKITPTYGGAAVGIASSFIFAGGYYTSSGSTNRVEYFNGTSWVELTRLSSDRKYPFNVGTAYNNAIIAGGESSTTVQLATTERFNGSTWTSASPMVLLSSAGSSATSSDRGVAVGGCDNGYIRAYTQIYLRT